MPVYESFTPETENRELVTASDLRLGFDLSDAFCAAAYHATELPIRAILAATGARPAQGSSIPAMLETLPHVHVTKPVYELLEGVITKAWAQEARRTGDAVPNEAYNRENLEKVISGCISHGHRGVPFIYKPA